jgi:hypothetical protein
MAPMIPDPELDWIDKINPKEVYEKLVQFAGAPRDIRTKNNFVGSWISETENNWHEWRFGGNLGFGGKIRRIKRGVIGEGYVPSLFVDCYSEDMNRRREEITQKTNEAILGLMIEASLRKKIK